MKPRQILPQEWCNALLSGAPSPNINSEITIDSTRASGTGRKLLLHVGTSNLKSDILTYPIRGELKRGCTNFQQVHLPSGLMARHGMAKPFAVTFGLVDFQR